MKSQAERKKTSVQLPPNLPRLMLSDRLFKIVAMHRESPTHSVQTKGIKQLAALVQNVIYKIVGIIDHK